MTKEPQEEINRLMNEKLDADKISLNPPLKFEPQEETYQTLENKALGEFEKLMGLPIPKIVEELYKSHLQLAYKSGEEKGYDEGKDGLRCVDKKWFKEVSKAIREI